MISAEITVLGDALSFARWLRDNATEDQEEIIYQLSAEITELQEMLAGRIRLVNFGRDPTPLEAQHVFEHIATERGESVGVACIGAGAVRHAIVTGATLPRALSAGTQTIMMKSIYRECLSQGKVIMGSIGGGPTP